MVKTVEVVESVPVDLDLFWQLFLEDSTFQRQYHDFVGNKGVDVIDWIGPPGSKEKQRICFFTMVENEGKSELENTKCTETQKCLYAPGDRELELRCNIRPEKLGAAIFVIDSVWRVSRTELAGGVAASRVQIKVTVECTKKIWGVTGMIENVLEQQTQSAHARWLQLAQRRAEEYRAEEAARLSRARLPHTPPADEQSSAEYSEPEMFRAGGSSRSVRSSRLHAHPSALSPRRPPRVRLRLATLKRVVNGTEKIAHMFSSVPFASLRESLSDKDVKGMVSSSSAEGLTDIAASHDMAAPHHDHVDSDLEAVRGSSVTLQSGPAPDTDASHSTVRRAERRKSVRPVESRSWTMRIAIVLTLLLLVGLLGWVFRDGGRTSDGVLVRD